MVFVLYIYLYVPWMPRYEFITVTVRGVPKIFYSSTKIWKLENFKQYVIVLSLKFISTRITWISWSASGVTMRLHNALKRPYFKVKSWYRHKTTLLWRRAEKFNPSNHWLWWLPSSHMEIVHVFIPCVWRLFHVEFFLTSITYHQRGLSKKGKFNIAFTI